MWEPLEAPYPWIQRGRGWFCFLHTQRNSELLLYFEQRKGGNLGV